MKKYTSIEDQVEFGINTVDPNQKVEIPIRDLLYLFQTLGELNRFFHQPLHYQSLDDINKFLGDKDSGAYSIISKCYYKILSPLLPESISNDFDDGVFDNPNPPYYYE